jgi:hypothetical protein
MSFYLPNPEVKPTGAEVAEFVDAIPPEFEAVTTPPPPPAPVDHEDDERGEERDEERDEERGDERDDGEAPA